MKKEKNFKKLLSLALVFCLILSLSVPAAAAEDVPEVESLRFEQVDNSLIEGARIDEDAVDGAAADAEYKDDEIVRVSIILEEDSVVDAGYSTEDILDNSAALAHMNKVKSNQKTIQRRIERATGSSLDVERNLAVVANIISAEVAYGDIEEIEAVSGVEKVVIETQYEPCTTTASPDMAISTSVVTGTAQAWADGYTGAGARIAIIDTGLDIDHQSFDNEAYVYAITSELRDNRKPEMGPGKNPAPAPIVKPGPGKKNNGPIGKCCIAQPDCGPGKNPGKGPGNNNGKGPKQETTEQLLKKATDKYDLLTDEKLAKALPYLNAYATDNSLTADELSVSNKIPFAFNYIDEDTNVRHIYDTQGEHGSHVAGIAAANRYIEGEDGYADALSTVGVAGNAPDAQVLVMKVFGKGGGAYDSDYMAAIEDAIILGCDAVNLSLGSGNAGMVTSTEYQDLLDKLTSTETVVVMSAGNSSAWADETSYGYLYDDGVNFDTAGSPGSFTNSLSVASVDNLGIFGYTFEVDGTTYSFTETSGYGNDPFVSLAGADELEYVFLDGAGEEADFEGIDVTGKVVFCKRGSISFYVKANNAVANGAIATVVYNNQAGTISMNLTGYEYTAPAISITQADAETIKAASTDMGGYYTGTMKVNAKASAVINDPGYMTMSSFSSWGVPGDLSMKPEITAPGGSIYSVAGTNDAGGGVDQYELMSGTSMAAPQVTGMMAVLKRYIELNGLKTKNLTSRGLAQSLMMSTATPMVDSYGYYYSVLQQGSGLANISDAMNADTYVTMGADATASYADGKVKAELGDDPDKNGVYSFTFTLTNISKKDVTYNLSADVFTQYTEQGFLFGDTDNLDATVKFSTGNKVKVKKNKSVTVKATIALTAETKAALNEYYPTGAYVEAYVYAKPTNGSSTHSIPVLGYYGSWTDPSMYDVGSYIEYKYGLETRAPYLYANNKLSGNAYTVNFGDGSGEYYFGGNLYASETEYHPEFASMNNENGDSIKSIYYALIRNAGLVAAVVSDAETGEIYETKVLGSQYGAYYYVNGSKWYGTSSKMSLNWAGTDADGEALPEGTKVNIDLIAAPEYYATEEGYDISKLGEGAYFSTALTIDNTAPEMIAVTDDESGSLGIIAEDNVGIAAVMLYSENGKTLLGRAAISQDSIATYIATGLDADVYLVAVVDYAGNMSTYRVFMNMEATDEVESVTISDESLVLMKNNSYALSAEVAPVNVSDDTVTWTSTDETVAVVNANGVMTAVGVGECEIIAAATVDPEMTASCAVTVIEIATELNGVVWDENGEVWFSQFNTANLPNYTKLTAASTNAQINGLAYGADGTLYATDLDTEEGVSNLYTVNADLSLNLVGASDIAYTDIAEAMGMGCLTATYYNYVVLVDPTTGSYLGAFNYLSSSNLVGIAYVGSMYHPTYGTYLDMYYFLDDAGNLYFDAFIELDGKYYYFYGEEDALMGNTGIKCDTPYFQSLYFNGEYTFASSFNESTNRVDLYALDTEDTGAVYNLGSFADSVWPVAGMCELGTADAATGNGAAFTNATVKAEASTEAIAVRGMSVGK